MLPYYSNIVWIYKAGENYYLDRLSMKALKMKQKCIFFYCTYICAEKLHV